MKNSVSMHWVNSGGRSNFLLQLLGKQRELYIYDEKFNLMFSCNITNSDVRRLKDIYIMSCSTGGTHETNLYYCSVNKNILKSDAINNKDRQKVG